jgi:hypothetical protein
MDVAPPIQPGTPAGPGRRAGQGRLIAGVAAGVVALAVLGFVVGWLAFHAGNPTPAASPTPVVTASVPPGSLAPLVLPDYTGANFVTARTELRGLQLGVRLYFGQGAEDPTVLRTEPAAGTPITRGLTVKVYVTGPAPLLTLPAVVGQQCNVGGKALADAGVYPQYPTGRAGVVVSTAPAADATTVHWNDTVKVTCARPGTSPSPVPSQSGSPGPDDSPLPDPSGSAQLPSTEPSA